MLVFVYGKKKVLEEWFQRISDFFLPAFGICSNAATALKADLLSSSCFSCSCLTELALTFNVHVALKGSTNWSSP